MRSSHYSQQSVHTSSANPRSIVSSTKNSVKRDFMDSKNPYLLPPNKKQLDRKLSRMGKESRADSDLSKLNNKMSSGSVNLVPYDDHLKRGAGIKVTSSAQRSSAHEPPVIENYD